MALFKRVYAYPNGTNLAQAVDGDWDSEAHTGNGSMPYIAVDLGSQSVIENVSILIRPGGKLILHS